MSKFISFDFVSREETKEFGKNQENRAFNHAHLGKIKEQFKTSFEMIPPITINTLTNHVVDGQHRLRAFQELVDSGQLPPESKIKVMFTEIPIDEEKQSIINANTNSKNWSLDDYILSYVKAGLIPYKILDEWCKSHSWTNENNKSKFRYGAAIIKGKSCQSELKDGTFNVSQEELDTAEIVYAEMDKIMSILGIQGKGAWIESFAVQWYKCRTQHPFSEWKKEFQAKKKSLQKMPKQNMQDWRSIIGQINTAIDINRS